LIGVTGASGRLGRLTVGRLRQHVDAARVLALSRTPEAAADLGVPTGIADFDAPQTLVRAFDGVERLLIVSSNVMDGTGRRIRQHEAAIRAAAAAGVGHVVYVSISRGGDPGHPAAVAADHLATERALAGAGVPYTVLRNNMYSQLILMGLERTLAAGALLDNSGDGASAYVTREDCAAVAAAVLAEGGHEGERLEVSGPQALTQSDIAALITEFSGVPVRYVPISDEQTVLDLVAHGMPERAARRFATIGTAVRRGYTSTVTEVVKRVTGRAATPVADLLAAAFGVVPGYTAGG
jgi:NAD(P)H dehydrogenase (quinone)